MNDTTPSIRHTTAPTAGQIDLLFDVLGQQRRRSIVSLLQDHDTLTLADIADAIAELEYERPISEIPENVVLQVYTSLYHTHVPKLTDANIVHYDQDREMLALQFDRYSGFGRLLGRMIAAVTV